MMRLHAYDKDAVAKFRNELAAQEGIIEKEWVIKSPGRTFDH